MKDLATNQHQTKPTTTIQRVCPQCHRGGLRIRDDKGDDFLAKGYMIHRYCPKCQQWVKPIRVGAKRVTFNRGDILSAIDAAKRLKSEKDLYIVPTIEGFTIERTKPPTWIRHVVVRPDGSFKRISPYMPINPTSCPSDRGVV